MKNDFKISEEVSLIPPDNFLVLDRLQQKLRPLRSIRLY
jgi:hypothetical protein